MEYKKLRSASALIREDSASVPAMLYHYTSPEAAVGIISNKELWASSTLFMNDTSETTYALDMAQRVIDARIKSNAGNEDALKFLTSFKEAFRLPISAAYIISFTALPDALSQWRAYCPPSGGYAIGLSTSHIKELINITPQPVPPVNGFKLLKCIYNPALQQQIMHEIIDTCIKEYEENLGKKMRKPVGGLAYTMTLDSYRNFALDCYAYIQEIALMFKHEGFDEEQEWRLAYFTNLENERGPAFGELSFRPSTRGIMPYKIFSLLKPAPTAPDATATFSTDPGLTVKVGPCDNPEQRRNALWLLSAKKGYRIDPLTKKDGRLTISATPYKSW